MRYTHFSMLPELAFRKVGGRITLEGGGQSGGATTSTTTTQNFSPEEAAQRAKVQEEASRIYNQSAAQLQNSPYPGSKPVPFSTATTQAQGMLSNFATGAGQSQANQAGAYSSWLQGPAQYAESNPYLQSTINAAIRPITQAYTDPGGVMSKIRTDSMAAGGHGTSSRQGIAEGIAARSYFDAVGDASTKLANENYQLSQKIGAQALALAPQTFDLQTRPATSLASVGQQQELYQQALADYDANAAMWQLNAPWLPLQNYANIVFGGASPGTTATGYSTGGGGSSPGRFSSALGGAAMGAQMGAMFGLNPLIGAGVGLLTGFF